MPRRRNRPLFLIDIAVPRDLDPEINTLDNVYLYDIDDLNDVVEMNREQRDKEAIKARRIVEEETLKFMRWLDGMEVTPTIVELQATAESICRAELDKTLPGLAALVIRSGWQWSGWPRQLRPSCCTAPFSISGPSTTA